MTNDIREQYNPLATTFSEKQATLNQRNREVAQAFTLPHVYKGVHLLDLCCGDGTDAGYFSELGAHVTGLDASSELLSIARQIYPHINFHHGVAEQLPFENEAFDIVFSKYAIMTSFALSPIFSEVHRVLKPDGVFIYLVTHPLRQYLEKKKVTANYFKQEIVNSEILDGSITVVEPTHAFSEYFNSDFFSKFDLLDYAEHYDPAAERVNGAVYPGFMIVKARKR